MRQFPNVKDFSAALKDIQVGQENPVYSSLYAS
jgi:hypothetical protein